MSNYLVTGGCGFIGSHIANTLESMGMAVRVLDFAPRANIRNAIEFIRGDIRDRADVARAMEGMDFVLHQAAIPSVPRSIEQPRYTNSCNVAGTVNLLASAKDAGVKHFVYASSSSVYGEQPNPKGEDMAPMPLSPYAVSKYAGECYCRSFEAVYGLPVTILRYFNVYGPGQKMGSAYSAVIANFLSAAMNRHRAVVYGDGLQTRDFTYVDDVVRANLLACEKREPGICVNVATGRATSVIELLHHTREVTGRYIEFRRVRERPGDLRDSVACVDSAKARLGYEPQVGLRTGLGYTWDWLSQCEQHS